MKELMTLALRMDLRGLLLAPTRNGWIQLFRALFVGAIAFAADAGPLWLLERLGVYYLPAAGFSFCLGVAVNYLLSSRFVFSAVRAGVNQVKEASVFLLLALVGLGLTEICLWLLVDKAGLALMPAKLITTVIVFIWNFSGRKYILYRGKGGAAA